MGKNLVLCCDGTWNRFGNTQTNVGKLCMMLERDPQRQAVYYDPGVGTIGSPGALTRLRVKLVKWLDGAIAHGLGQNVIEAYDFLSRRYEPNDRIFLFGFSRGAYTVRALAGMLHLYGLTDRGNEQLTPHIWTLYSARYRGARKKEQFEVARRFKATFSREVSIALVGVWDTVSSVGWVWAPLTLPFTMNNPSVEQARHAVAVDERRAFFRQNVFSPEQRGLKEVWFAGAHADVGGGYPESVSGLSQIALKWMVDQAQAHALLVNEDQKRRILGEQPPFVAPNALQPIHHSLHGWWYLLEIVPRSRWRSDGRYVWGPNLGAPRRIRPNAVLHASVKQKLDQGNYRPPNLLPDNPYPFED